MKLTPAKEEDIHVGFVYYCPGTDNKQRTVRQRLLVDDMIRMGLSAKQRRYITEETPEARTAYLNALRGMVAQGGIIYKKVHETEAKEA